MAPNNSTTATECNLSSETAQQPPSKEYKVEIVWRNVIIFLYLHIAALYGLYLLIYSAQWKTNAFALAMMLMGGFGITAGAHRLWAHKTYKARLPLQILLAIWNAMAFQNSIYEWSRDHRLHHKYSDTNADPHNANRGFFFAHIGWLLCRKHPQVKEKGKGIDMSDLKRDPIVMFQHKYYLILMPVCCFLLPTFVPVYFWDETLSNAWFVPTVFRYVLSLQLTWLINSAAHLYGTKPYDKSINPGQNLCVAIGVLGEGWHNYHHVFPWDYKTAELGDYKTNFTTFLLDFMAMIGMAYDLKTVPDHLIKSRVRRTGDGTHPWGWGDKDIPEEERKDATILYPEQVTWGWDDKDLPEDERIGAETHFKRK